MVLHVLPVLSKAKVIGVLDRSLSFGSPYGPLCTEILAALYGKDIPVRNFVYGLGGRDIFVDQIAEVGEKLADMINGGEDLPAQSFIGLRE